MEAKGPEADTLKRKLPRASIAQCAVKMLFALSAPLVPVSCKKGIAKATWHGQEMIMDVGMACGGAKDLGSHTPPFVRSRAGVVRYL